MIRRLRIRLTLVAAASLLGVLLLIMGTVNILNYRQILREADQILNILKENQGKFPQREPEKGEWAPGRMSPELPFESRYFSVLLTEEGEVIATDTGRIAAVDEESAAELATEVLRGNQEKGMRGIYRFARYEEEGGIRIIFLDCSRNLSTFRSFLWASIAICLSGLIAVSALILLFSGRIIRPIVESYEKQKRFITDAGHELRTPITIIDADTEVLRLETGENEWLSDIQLQTKRLTALTKDLVYLSRMEEDQKQRPRLEFSLSDLAEETAQSFQGPARVQNKDFRFRIEPMLSYTGDENALRQLFSILLDNALKYSPEGGRILFGVEKQGKTISLWVENSTKEALPQDLNRLFERFYRGDPSRNSQSGGYGLGLSIAQAIVTAHKGRITAKQGSEGNLRICVSLPD